MAGKRRFCPRKSKGRTSTACKKTTHDVNNKQQTVVVVKATQTTTNQLLYPALSSPVNAFAQVEVKDGIVVPTTPETKAKGRPGRKRKFPIECTTEQHENREIAKVDSPDEKDNSNLIEDEKKHVQLERQRLIALRDEKKRRLDELTIIPLKLQPPKRLLPVSAAEIEPTVLALGQPIHQIFPTRIPIVNNALKSIDTHRDYLFKEMQWLATDYASERKRHMAVGRRVSASVINYFHTKEQRFDKLVINAKLKRKKLASKLASRIVQQQFWSRLEKVITYKQKLSMEMERNRAMNQQLVKLVKQTEKYSESLLRNDIYEHDASDLSESGGDDDNDVINNRRNGNTTISIDQNGNNNPQDRENADTSRVPSTGTVGHRGRRSGNRVSTLTIEQALAAPIRKSKRTVTNYDQLNRSSTFAPVSISKDSDDDNSQYSSTIMLLYRNGDNPERNDNSDGDRSYNPEFDSENSDNNTDIDDETTLRQAEIEELQERQLDVRQLAVVDVVEKQDVCFQADPNELRMLQEEAEMDILKVLERFTSQSNNVSDESCNCSTSNEMIVTTTKQVQFAPNVHIVAVAQTIGSTTVDLGDAHNLDLTNKLKDVPGDTNEVLKEINLKDTEDEDYMLVEEEADDETTMEQEEKMPQEMSAEEEVRLLEEDNDISVEELRKRYRVVLQESTKNNPFANDVTHDFRDQSSIDDHDNDESDQDEYDPAVQDENAIDDERTMVEEETLGRDMSYEEELAMLQHESEMPIEQLRAMYSLTSSNTICSVDTESNAVMKEQAMMSENDVDDNRTKPNSESSSSDARIVMPVVIDDECVRDIQKSLDQETTLDGEEKVERTMSYETELVFLQNESEKPNEQHRAMYDSQSNDTHEMEGEKRDRLINVSNALPTDMVVSSSPLDQQDASSTEQPVISSSVQTKRSSALEMDDDGGEDHSNERDSCDDGKIALERLERSSELARQTLASRPFLLAPWLKMREYQQTGLNWLVSLQSRRLNGILADEMGLGKTLQTISLIAYLAAYKGIWGPHLIVVPTSVMLNWETELKRFCPSLKVLCYYGTAKRRKELRTGWTDTNWAHVVITSYQLAVQDSVAFKRKRWYYLVLDEAQHIKNFQSQRWQTLIHFNTQRRLLLTGTPLQNNLMELWSLLHFLMPHVFKSRKEFSYWFANPMTSMLEGAADRNQDVVNRLHGIIRPFVLRRLKKDVETQMPGKFEHILKCHLSRRQMLIYEEFMARSSTRQALRKGGNFMGMMNVLMQLRKVCNHPDLFEPRSIVTPFVVDPIALQVPYLVHSSVLPDVRVDDYLLAPIWSGSQGVPSVHNCLKHNTIESDELLEFEYSLPLPSKEFEYELEDYEFVPYSVQVLTKELIDRKNSDKLDNVYFLNELNRQRCSRRPSILTDRLISVLTLKKENADSLATPKTLLALQKDQLTRSNELSGLIKKFVFCVPKVGAACAVMNSKGTAGTKRTHCLNEMLQEPVRELLLPFREVNAKLASDFPEKNLIQFDAGKLQILATLLRERKQGGHKILIFTQMGKMLDVLEAFLNLNGHTYLRLDGSTGVDRRQRLMDRFNSDPKIFCFILSTRSGGVGINLTGADTVIFYDSDWNPAIDAQAQDRAHRIGQTRDVHIYRLVTQHTVEENILLKARQKRNLDILVLDAGKFDASQHAKNAVGNDEKDTAEVKDVYTKKGLMSILGVTDDDEDLKEEGNESTNHLSNDQIESTMIALEDDEDANALRGIKKEADDELKEFDEAIDYARDSESDGDEESKQRKTRKEKVASTNIDSDNGNDEEREMEKEFAAWQEHVGIDASAIEATLAPIERYGLRFREEVDPFHSVFAVLESRRRDEAAAEADVEMDIDEIERQKAVEERRAIRYGEILATNTTPEHLLRQRNLYRRERARLRGQRKRRKVTGENWEQNIDNVTNKLFWHNIDTGETRWNTPNVLIERDEINLALERKWSALPSAPLIHVMGFLLPQPDRGRCKKVCKYWRQAASDSSFIRHVYPAELASFAASALPLERNHYTTIEQAVANALPGDTIELGDGHYWQNGDLLIDKPLRIVGDDNNPSNVIIELKGTITWIALGGLLDGITLRRPNIASNDSPVGALLELDEGGKLDIRQCVLDNEGCIGNVVNVKGPGPNGTWTNSVFQVGSIGVHLLNSAVVNMDKCTVRRNVVCDVACDGTSRLVK